MGLFKDIKRILSDDDEKKAPINVPKANVDILNDIDTLLNDIKFNKLILINPEMYQRISEALNKIREQWITNEQLGSKKSYVVQSDVINQSINYRFEFERYMNREGKNKLIELFVKEIFEDTGKILEESKNNSTNFIELLNRLQRLFDSYQGYDFLKNSERLTNQINQTRYEVIKNGYYLNRSNNNFEFNDEVVTMFSKYIIHDVYNFISGTYSDKVFQQIQEELELAILFGDLNDINNIKRMFELMQKTNGKAFSNPPYEEQSPDIKLKLLPDNDTVQVTDGNNKIIEVTKKIKELQVYDEDHYKQFLMELSKLKIDFYKNQTDPKMIDDINFFLTSFEDYYNKLGKNIQHSQLVDTTLNRIKATDSLDALNRLAKEIEDDPALSKIGVLKDTLTKMLDRRTDTVFAVKKEQKDMTDLDAHRDDILKNAQQIIAHENSNPDLKTNKKIVDQIARLINQELTSFSLQQLFVLINYYETGTIDYDNYAKCFQKFSPEVTKMLVLNESDYFFEQSPINTNYLVVRINNKSTNESTQCSGYTLDHKERLDLSTVMFNQKIMALLGTYNLDRIIGTHKDQIINLIDRAASSVIDNGLIPTFMLNSGLSNNLTVEQIRAYIEDKLQDLKNDSITYNALMNLEMYAKIKYIVEEYSKNYTESQAESMLLSLIPNLDNVDVTYLAFKILFAYQHDLEYLNKVFQTKDKQKSLNI